MKVGGIASGSMKHSFGPVSKKMLSVLNKVIHSGTYIARSSSPMAGTFTN